MERDAERTVAAEARAQQARVREAERAARQRVALERQAAREIERELSRSARDRARESARAERESERRRREFFGGPGGRIGIGRRAAIGVTRGVAALYGYGGAALSSAARAYGLETDMGALANKGIEYESKAQQVINAAPSMTGTSVTARQSEASGLLKQAQTIANETASDTGDVLDATRKFVALTGDLDTARATIGDIAKLSRATGSSLEDMAAASAEVSNHLGDVPNKAELTLSVMRAIAGEGKLGALEIRDMARQMAKIASQAPKFEGDTGKTIAILGAMAQESKLRGGSATATQAATSVMRFAQDLTKGTTVKNWAKAGLTPFTDASRTTLRSPEELILEALKFSKGNLVKLGQLFPNAMSMRAVTGFASIYSENGGGTRGLEAVDAEFRRLSVAAMTQEEVTRAFNAQMETTQSKVQVFNNHMQQAAERIAGALVPAIEAMAPVVVSLTEQFAGLVGLALGRSEHVEDEKNQFGTQAGIINTVGKLHAWERGHLVPTTGEGFTAERDKTAAENMAAAAPLLASLKKEEASAGGSMADIQKKLDKERAELVAEGKAEDPYLGVRSVKEIDAAIAAMTNSSSPLLAAKATQYINDKQAQERLTKTIGDLHGAITDLTSALTSGRVRVVGGAPPGPGASPAGTAPANSEIEP